MARKLTDKFLGGESGASKAAMPPAGKPQVDHWDTVAPGLGVRVGKTGRRSFVIWYRWHGKARRDTIKPPYPATTLEAARAEARQTALDVEAGRDPRIRRERPKQQAAKAETYQEAVQDYVKRYQTGQERNRTATEVERALLRVGGYRKERKTGKESEVEPKWLDRPVTDITAVDVRRELERIRDGDEDTASAAPYMANRTFAYLRTFFAWCAEPGVEKVKASPVAGLKKPWSGEANRDRWYSDEELAAIWKAADTLSDHSAALVKLLILTGKRKSAIAAMQWDEIDDSYFWQPPKDLRRKRGNKRTHAIPLPSLAQRIIRPLARIKDNPYVFPGRKDGRHLEAGSRLQRTVAERSGIDDFGFHANRHSVETALAKGWETETGVYRVPPHIRDNLLDHAPARGAGAGYDHHGYEEEMREALEAWSARIGAILRKHNVWTQDAAVTPLRG